MLKPGQLIENRYEVIKVLGKGGMSVVYLVWDNRLDHNFVLKEFTFRGEDQQEEKELQEHFEREAKLCAKLSHPAIPGVIDYFTINDRHYLVEEYVDGRTLISMVEEKPFDQARTIDVGLKLGSVLKYIHSMGIVYRDLKPDNVMVMDDGSIKLIDFGIARVYKAGKSKDTVIIGTPGFAAPEQYGTAQTDHRSDIYSLGAVLHHLLTGRDPREKPFNFDRPSSMGVEISPKLEHAIMKALSIKAEDRYQDVEDMIGDLKEAEKETSKLAGKSTRTLQEEPAKTNQKKVKNGERASSKKSSAGGVEKKSTVNKILVLVYAVIIIMFFGLLVRIRFSIWVIIPYVLVAWLIVTAVYRIWGK